MCLVIFEGEQLRTQNTVLCFDCHILKPHITFVKVGREGGLHDCITTMIPHILFVKIGSDICIPPSSGG